MCNLSVGCMCNFCDVYDHARSQTNNLGGRRGNTSILEFCHPVGARGLFAFIKGYKCKIV